MARTRKILPPRQWEIDDLLDLGKREKGKANYLKAIPILILEKWVQEGRIVGEANHIRTKPFARRLEDCKLVHIPFKIKGTSNILGALGAIQSDRNLTRPPLMNTDKKIGGSLINLPFYEPLLQAYLLKYQQDYWQDYKKLFPEIEPNWGVTEEQIKHIKIETSLEKSEMQVEVRNLLAPIEKTLSDRQQAIERLTKENQKLHTELILQQQFPF